MCWTGKQCELNNVTRPFTCNSGCTLNNKCYPYGYRKSSQYCKEDSQFTKQTENNIACENNFECKSNVCVDNKCINQGLFEKFLY